MIYGHGVIAKLSHGTDVAKFKGIILNAAGCPHPNQVDLDAVTREYKHVEDLCRTMKNKWMIHCSTPAVLGYGSSFGEDDDYRTDATDYGILKRECEKKLLDSFPNLTILRIFSLTSVLQEKQLVWDAFIKMAAPKASFSISENQTRDFVHQLDFQKYLSFIVKNEIKGIINITNTESSNLRHLILQLGALMGNCKIDFDNNSEQSNYLNLSSNTSSLFKLGVIPSFVGDDAPIDIFKKLIDR